MRVGHGLKGIINLYKNHSVACTGMKGSGKDMLTSNVVCRRREHYCCNIDYTHDDRFVPLDFNMMRLGNRWYNFVEGKLKSYFIPLPDFTDIYISDAGIYLPAQYCNEINKQYPDIATFMAIQRHLNCGKTHYNCQNLVRVYDKIREMCDVFIYSEWCKVLFGKIVIQSVIVYDKAQSCQDRVKPCRVRSRGLIPSKEAETQRDIYLDHFYNTHGTVERRLLIYINKSDYDTRHFKKLLEVSNEI